MKIEIPEIDTDSGLGLCDGDLDIYKSSLRLYAANIPKSLDIIRSVKNQDVSPETLKEYIVKVHGVKGMSEYIGAETARKNAKELEMMGKAGDINGILAGNETFIIYIENLVNNINNWLLQNG